MITDETPVVHVKQLAVEVDYSQTYLVDEGCDAGGFEDVPSPPVGVIRVEKGSALLIVGPQWGPVEFTVAVADRDPGADLDGYEDIVEISYESPSGQLSLQEWGGGRTHRLPPLPAGPGTYRLRYHIRGMDEEVAVEIGDHYFLQIWPEPPHDPTVVKSTSSSFQYWLNAERSRQGGVK
ncbi:hypothetical protein [Nonomuraea gerenzanensis]|uniref:hypothetical protein n=1 Tax=Nonomuraea gerenzanensis TaxID=93944 RepID=UPI001CD9EEDA|nr:hypothetical protein [Nonomuraea gerenzanensis]UBU14106.1 hypothetical protein LCN96_03480 [Nonomuraea gerenzanensis]